jgi:plastocyanin
MLRLGLPALLGASLGCSQGALLPGDAGRSVPDVMKTASQPKAEALGSVEGRVLWLAPRPAPVLLQTSPSVQSVCGKSVVDNAFRVDAHGGVADVVVWAEAPAEKAGTPRPEAVLDQRLCLYQPPVLAAFAGATLRLRNSDPLTHTVHARDNGKTLFNVAMPLERMDVTRQLPSEPGVVAIGCDVHAWMRAVVRTFDQPHFTTTSVDGRFRLPSMEAGEAVLHAWHPTLGEASVRARVGEGVTQTEFKFGGRP